MTIVSLDAYREVRNLIIHEDESHPILEIIDKLDKIKDYEKEEVYYMIQTNQISLKDFLYWIKTKSLRGKNGMG